MKKLSLLLVVLSLSSCIGLYDLSGVNPRLIPTVQEVRNNNVDNRKYGEACVNNVLYLVATGDSSIETAAKNGNINKISSVYTKYFHFMLYIPVYQEGCTVVVGE